ncbi:ribonuclease J [Curvivirga aplysinae]|uniref:ribonuclease J n=1 Tax=Curvivirga aplysinae TaxID=2529852 RepID=UPI0012BD11A4|nr:ribonuclease J [Curvivirga aplysinae]MTI09359.1 ribonuclease J [Curvivirga aplysinae]
MSEYHKTGKPGKDELLFLPLGGSGEIGMNLNLYGYNGKWLMVDYGITFGDVTTPGIDVIFPDPTFIEDRADDLVGLVLTHAHEDHLGAVPYLWDCFDCPIYATPFTAAILRKKLEESQFIGEANIIEVPLSGQFEAGPFELELVSLTHSIPEPNALIIRTEAGSVMHTGDWKLDPDPLLGPTADEERLIQAGKDGITAMVCDSTNALVPGRSGSEADVRENLVDIVSKIKGGVAIACFASNVARLESAAVAASKSGRAVCLVGRSLWRMTEAAKATGYLQDMPPFLEAEEVKDLPKEKVLYICTGSQGEPRAALARIARGDHRDVSFGKGDTVIFSSREIPGNEISINRVQNGLVENGVTLITADDYEIHTSGHPNKDELAQMYQWIRPDVAIPVHGELRHMMGHAQLAKNCQVPHGIVPRNGALIKITKDGADVIDEVPNGRLALDGNRITPLDSISLRDRRKMGWGGMIFATVVVDAKGRLYEAPKISVEGLLEDHEEDEFAELTDTVELTVKRLDRDERLNDKKISEAVRIALRRQINDICGKKPKAQVHLVRI